MSQFFIRETRYVELDDGSNYTLIQGVRDLPDRVVKSRGSHKFGVVPLHEMTAAERSEYGLPTLDPTTPENERPHQES